MLALRIARDAFLGAVALACFAAFAVGIALAPVVLAHL